MDDDSRGADGGSLIDAAIALAGGVRWLLLVPLIGAAVTFGAASLWPKTYTARTVLLPPQQQQGGAAAALASLGALAGLAGGGVRTPADQFAAFMQSTGVADRIIDRFELLKSYDVDYRFDARRVLASRVDVAVGKKDGLISVEVVDRDPKRAAEIANAYVDELRRITSTLAVTEAQQRRVFFERQLEMTRDRLTNAQQVLQSSGFSLGALRSEPRVAAETYARLRAEITATEVRLQALRSSFADSAAEVQQTASALTELRTQLARAEGATDVSRSPDYVSKYREFKYQETLFDLFARQYEIARVDESREGSLIQVVDVALPPEKNSGPRRVRIALVAFAALLVITAGTLMARASWRRSSADPRRAAQLERLRAALRRRAPKAET
jgi:uncharacterized protein involved in exopolysaccharide biosynthesis